MAAYLLLKALRDRASGLGGTDKVIVGIILVGILYLVVAIPLILILDSYGVLS